LLAQICRLSGARLLRGVRRHLVARRQIFVGFAIVAILSIVATLWLIRSRNSVAVDVVNASSRPIQWARLKHEDGVQMLGAIPVGESRRAEFRSRGETTYQVSVKFDDGTELSGEGAYAEAGYTFTDTVTDSAITTHLEDLRY
jgi:hypothetical protein